jgi:hypothetical protein
VEGAALSRKNVPCLGDTSSGRRGAFGLVGHLGRAGHADHVVLGQCAWRGHLRAERRDDHAAPRHWGAVDGEGRRVQVDLQDTVKIRHVEARLATGKGKTIKVEAKGGGKGEGDVGVLRVGAHQGVDEA